MIVSMKKINIRDDKGFAGLAVLIVVVMLAVGAFFLLKKSAGTESAPTPQNPLGDNTVSASREAMVVYDVNGFSPSSVTVRKGTAVHFINKSGAPMWVASAVHPTHTLYAGTTLQEHCGNGATNDAFDECGGGDDYSFVFSKTGEWNYHDHLHARMTGTVVVIEK